jgi:hypothetical protein
MGFTKCVTEKKKHPQHILQLILVVGMW